MAKLLMFLLPIAAAVALFRVNALLSGRGLKRQSHPLRNDEVERALVRLADAAEIDLVRVRVLDRAEINGLATPEGDIYVTRGLVDALRGRRITLSEFVSVVAHELGHLAHGHARRRLRDIAGAQLIGAALIRLLARFIPVVGLFAGWVARLILSLFFASLSRKNEFEADGYATALMIRAGFGAEPQARMLEKLAEMHPGATPAAGSWLASHPPVVERAAAIRANAGRWTTGAGPNEPNGNNGKNEGRAK